MRKLVCMLTSGHKWDDVRIFQREARSLTKAGYQVSLIAPSSTVRYGGWSHQMIDGIDIWLMGKHSMYSQRVMNVFRLLFKAVWLRASIYHLHDPDLLMVVFPLRYLTRAKIVYDRHEFLDLDLRNRLRGPMVIRQSIRYFVRRLETAVLRHLDGLVLAYEEMYSEWMASRLVTVLRNYAAKDWYCQGRVRSNGGELRLVYVGFINRTRGLGTLLDALRRLQESHSGIRCTIVGRVEDDLPEKLPNNISFLGDVSFDASRRVLEAGDVALLPWEDTEYNRIGFPNKLTEYMAVGLPIVVSNIGRVSEIVRSNGCGLEYSAGDPQSLANAIHILLENVELRNRLGAAGRKAFEQKYCWEIEVQRLMHFYDALVPSSEASQISCN